MNVNDEQKKHVKAASERQRLLKKSNLVQLWFSQTYTFQFQSIGLSGQRYDFLSKPLIFFQKKHSINQLIFNDLSRKRKELKKFSSVCLLVTFGFLARLPYLCLENLFINKKHSQKMNALDKILGNAIVKAYQMQRSFDTAVIIVFRSRNSLVVGNNPLKLEHTANEETLIHRLERLKEAKVIFSYDKQGSGKIIKVLIREVRKQGEKKERFLRQIQLQLF
jgi:hypothetical protein